MDLYVGIWCLLIHSIDCVLVGAKQQEETAKSVHEAEIRKKQLRKEREEERARTKNYNPARKSGSDNSDDSTPVWARDSQTRYTPSKRNTKRG